MQIQCGLSSLSLPAGWWGGCCVMYTVQTASTYTGTWGEARQTTCRDHHQPGHHPPVYRLTRLLFTFTPLQWVYTTLKNNFLWRDVPLASHSLVVRCQQRYNYHSLVSTAWVSSRQGPMSRFISSRWWQIFLCGPLPACSSPRHDTTKCWNISNS